MGKILNAEKYLSNDVLNLKTFNGVFFAVMGFMVLLCIAVWLIFRNKSEKAKTIFITAFCAFNVLVFFVYKIFLCNDTSYLEANGNGFNWFSELPLHLCNINMFLVPIGAITKKRGILGFAFIMAPFGAIMAMVAPCAGFSGYTLLLPRMLGFYLTHVLVFVGGVSLATLNIYRPKFKDLPRVFITLVIIGILMTGVNLLIRKYTSCDFANYFFTMDPDGAPILVQCYSLVKIPFVYLLPATPILLVYMAVICSGFKIADKISTKKNTKIDAEEQTKETVSAK
ncbi:MAG: YwaF family protein [Clostridia bacterium]|nr:YwaF family protein [Clostridia bacterium]